MRQKTAQVHFILLATSEYACSISWSAGHVFVNSSRAYALFKYLQMPVISEGNSKSLYLLATIWKRRGNSQEGKTHKHRQLHQTIHSSEACNICFLKFPCHSTAFQAAQIVIWVCRGHNECGTQNTGATQLCPPIHHRWSSWPAGMNLLYCLVTQSCPALLWPHGLWPTRLLCPWDFPGKNTGVGHHFLLQGIFLTQGLNPNLLH